jgi:hypothetical protein
VRLNFLQLPLADRQLYFEQAAARRGLSSVILEKDFWVCWLLGVLFDSRFGSVLVFKGGTSLSKVFGAIQRFSEDIDLSLAPDFLGLADVNLEQALSRNQANKWMAKAEAACARMVQDQVQPELEGVGVAPRLSGHARHVSRRTGGLRPRGRNVDRAGEANQHTGRPVTVRDFFVGSPPAPGVSR